MEPFALMMWIFVVPLHAYVLQPKADVAVTEDSGREGISWYEEGKGNLGEPFLSTRNQDTHGEDGTEQEKDSRAEAGEVEREEHHDANGVNQADDEEGKRHEESHREGKMDEEKKEVMQRSRDADEGREFEVDLKAEEKEGAHRDDDEKEKEDKDEKEVDERQVKENRKENNPVEDEMVGEVIMNLREYTVEDSRGEMEGISSHSVETDIPHLTLNPTLFIETISHLSPNPSPSTATDMPDFSLHPDLSIEIISHFSPNPSPSTATDIPDLSLYPGLSVETDFSHLNPNPNHNTTTSSPHLSPNPTSSIATDIPRLSPNSSLSVPADIPHLSFNPDPSVATDIPHLNPKLDLYKETDIPNLSPNSGVFIETDISRLSPTPIPSLYVNQNTSVSHQGLDTFQTLLSTADSSVTPTVSQGPKIAGESEQPSFTAVKPISKLVQLWNLTDSPRSHLREREGLAPKATEVKVDSFIDLTNTNLDIPGQKRPEKKRSKVNQLIPKPKKKKTHPGKKTEGKKQKNKAKAEEKNKKDKNKKNKKKQKENKKTENDTYFPYFKDDYCPPECACYGRVVQCSDKSLDKLPYGIPYNARYILLMNNQISGIQLDLLREYISLEFLVLSNNLLTDGGIEGAFEGIRQLKRLYLDKNHLDSIPTDLPLSLEELRLDSNNVSEISEVAWVRSHSLQILSLNNNSLGAQSVPDGVFTPLTSLRTLTLIHNLLTAVPVNLPTNIKELYLRGNHIDQVPGNAFAEGSELLVLDLSANRLTNKGLTKNSLRPLVHLENLNLEGNLLRNIPQHLPPTLRTLNLEGNAITTVSKVALLGLPQLEHLGLSRNQITKVAPGAFWGLPTLHQLELGHNILRQVPRRLPPSLHSVSLIHNKIRSIPRDSFCTKGKDSSLSSLVRVHLEHNLIHLADLDTEAFSCLRGYQVIHFY